MKPRFEPAVDSEKTPPSPGRLIDPEECDASEQRFAASLEEKPALPRFVPDILLEPTVNVEAQCPEVLDRQEDPIPEREETLEPAAESPAGQPDTGQPADRGSWRGEVAARVNNYRARRRPREPRYPSLQLKFDPPQPGWETRAPDIPAPVTSSSGQLAVALQEPTALRVEVPIRAEETDSRLNPAEGGAKIIEFPRSGAPATLFDELAEPVADRPRILDVPESLPPPPALGGILIEAAEQPEKERRPGFELPLRPAPMSKRLLAGAVDSLLVISAFAIFAYIFFRVTSIVPVARQWAGVSAIFIVVFWAAYEYLLLVYAGTTPGLKLAGLRLSRFDGTAVPRRIRRWRVLASMLSGLSLALGYAWCFMDEDQLCWHDRITRTYMAPHERNRPAPNLSEGVVAGG